MENGLKAFLIAGSTLIAVILFATVSYFFQHISRVPTQQDELQEVEQLRKFNLEYEIYDKSAMYGVDVLSCLNKAVSNNEKYAKGEANLAGSKYGDDYLIDVSVTLKTPLTESIEVKAINANGKEIVRYESDEKVVPNITLEEAGFEIVGLTSFKADTKLSYAMTNNDKSLRANVEHSILVNMDAIMTGEINAKDRLSFKKLLANPADIKQTIKNKESNVSYRDTNGDGTIDEKGWSTATWYTFLYDFKKRRFKCTEIEYSSVTGRINKIKFVEI